MARQLALNPRQRAEARMEVCGLLNVNRWCVARAMRLSDPRVNNAREQYVAPDFKPKSTIWDWDRTATEPEANAAEW